MYPTLFPRPFSIALLVCAAWATATSAQFRVPHTDDEGNVRIPGTESIHAFHSQLPVESLALDSATSNPSADVAAERQRSETAEDRSLSLALFGQGRMAFRHEDFAASLAAYQRAWFWNPTSKSILMDVPWLAFQLDRPQCAFRYAILASEPDPDNPSNSVDLNGLTHPLEMLGDLGMLLAENGEVARGFRLIQSAIKKHQREALLDNRPEKDRALVLLHLNHASLALEEEKFQDAADSFEILKDAIAHPSRYGMDTEDLDQLLDPKPAFYERMAKSYVRSRQFAKAEGVYDQLHALENDPALHAYHLAFLRFHQGKRDQCREHLNAYFQSRSTAAGEAPYRLLGKTYTQNAPGESADFVKAMKKLTLADPANPVLANHVGKLMASTGRYEMAQELLEPLLADQPAPSTWRALMTTYVGRELPGKTVALLGLAVDTTGDLLLLEDALPTLTDNESAFQAFVKEAQRRRNDNLRPMSGSEALGVAIVCLRADGLPENQKFADQFYAYSAAHSSKEDLAEQQLTWAEECYYANHLSAAARYFAKSLEDPPEGVNIAGITELLAVTQTLDGKADQGLKTIDNALQSHPGSATLMARRNWVLYQDDRVDDAETGYRAMIARFADDYSEDSVREALKDARSMLSNILAEHDQLEEATELLLTILDEFPEDAGAQNDLSYLWADARLHPQKARALAESAVAKSPDNPAYLDTLAWAQFRLGNNEQALKLLLQATDEHLASDLVILDHLADVQAALGKAEDARKTWQRAIDTAKKRAKEEEREVSREEEELILSFEKKIDQHEASASPSP